MKNFFVVALPIGNLEDISKRAEKTLFLADLIISEDTRVTKKLLSAFGVTKKELISYHKFSKKSDIQRILKVIQNKENVVLVSDAGTPAISDPGAFLVREVIEKTDFNVVGIPGPSSITLALSISGFDCDKFVFLGFVPHKKGKEKFFDEVRNEKRVVVFFESKHRILKTMQKLTEIMPERNVMIARELTKMFETIYRGKVKEVYNFLKDDKVLGEFTIVLDKVK